MERKPGELTGVFESFRQRWPRDDQLTETIIGEVTEQVSDGFIRHTIKGTCVVGSLTPGLTYRFWGRHATHDRYGEQFFFESFIEQAPATKAAVCLYLQQVDGIGPATAAEMWQRWHEHAVERLREQPEVVASIMKRLTPEQCRAGSDLLKKKQRTERGKMELMELVHKAGIPKKIVDVALNRFGAPAAKLIRRNPYLLMRFRGIGFLKADRLYLDFRHDPGRLKRQALACWFAITRDGEGHVWFPLYVARDFLRRHISGAEVRFERAMELATRSGLLQLREHGGHMHVAERSRADAEGRIARLIELARVESRGGTQWPDVGKIGGLTDHQREQLGNALQGVVSFLAGSPGTGKTFTAAALIKAVRRLYPSAMIAAAAPTGKAAVRLTESLERAGVSLAAKTIHGLLGVASGGDDDFSFQHNAKNPIPFKFVFIDESSMIDDPLFAALLEARPMGCHYLFLGDPNQLAPVGYGAPLRDLLRCEESAPSGTLSEIRRNSGRGVETCAAIRDRLPWQPSKKLEVDAGENLIIAHTETPADQIETLSTLVRRFRDQQKYDPIWDVQVICAVNRKGDLARQKLNPLLQDILNPAGETVKDCPFRVGDKIVNLKNGLLKSDNPNDETDENGCVYVANGEQAEVTEIKSGGVVVAKLTNPSRTVLIFRKAKSDNQKAAESAAGRDEPENENEESSNTGCSWELGYAISAHKSQGSEWPVVIVMLDTDPAARRTCSRQWLYTAISRFKSFAILIGTKKTADQMTGRDSLFVRRTLLRERVEEMRAETATAERPVCEHYDPDNSGNCVICQLPVEEWRDDIDDEFDLSEVLEGVL